MTTMWREYFKNNFRTRGDYGNEKFTYSTALVFCFCVANFVYASVMSKVLPDQGLDTTPTYYYLGCALTYSVAMVASNKVINDDKYYTLQITLKSSQKNIPWNQFYRILY